MLRAGQRRPRRRRRRRTRSDFLSSVVRCAVDRRLDARVETHIDLRTRYVVCRMCMHWQRGFCQGPTRPNRAASREQVTVVMSRNLCGHADVWSTLVAHGVGDGNVSVRFPSVGSVPFYAKCRCALTPRSYDVYPVRSKAIGKIRGIPRLR